jgi:hypothetical protein
MENKRFIVDEPEDIGIVESVLKYTTITILIALVSYFAAFLLPFAKGSTRRNKEFRDDYFGMIFSNLEVFNSFIAFIAVGAVFYYIYSKNKYGRIFEIIIHTNFVELKIKNTFNNKIRSVEIPWKYLSITREAKNSDLFGKLEIVTFYSSGSKVNYFNTGITQWGNDKENYEIMMRELEIRQKSGTVTSHR